MYFGTKNCLKSNRNYTVKHTRSRLGTVESLEIIFILLFNIIFILLSIIWTMSMSIENESLA
jgi:hypothetical protein